MATKNKKTIYRNVPEEIDQEAKNRVLEDLKNREMALSTAPEGEVQEKTPQSTTAPRREIKSKPEPKQTIKYPWEQEKISKRVTKAYNIRIREPEFEKLKYVVQNSTDKSINSYVLRVVMKQVEKDLEQLT